MDVHGQPVCVFLFSLTRHSTNIYSELDMSTQNKKSFGDRYFIDVAHVTLDSRQKPKTSPPGYRADAHVDRDTVRSHASIIIEIIISIF